MIIMNYHVGQKPWTTIATHELYKFFQHSPLTFSSMHVLDKTGKQGRDGGNID